MRAGLIPFGLAIVLATGAAAEGEPRLIACYQKVTKPAQYSVKKVLIKKPERKYLKRNGRIELVEYPAVYREDRTLLREEHIVMQEIPCK